MHGMKTAGTGGFGPHRVILMMSTDSRDRREISADLLPRHVIRNNSEAQNISSIRIWNSNLIMPAACVNTRNSQRSPENIVELICRFYTLVMQ